MALSDANRKFFDSMSSTYDDSEWAKNISKQMIEAYRARREWFGIHFIDPDSPKTDKIVRLLDYACGTGLVSRALGPYVTSTLGIDISPKMVSTYNDRAAASGLPPSQISAVVGDLLAAEPSEALSGPEYFNFDMAVVNAGYHHFDDVLLCTKRLSERLKPGGTLVISDFLQGPGTDVFHGYADGRARGEHDHGHGHGHSHSHHHGHHGHEHDDLPQDMRASIKVFAFDEAGVRAFFEEAGLVDFEITTLEEKVYMEFAGKKMERTVFFAKGQKPYA